MSGAEYCQVTFPLYLPHSQLHASDDSTPVSQLSFTKTKVSGFGDVQLYPNGSATYTPYPSEYGTDSFKYTATDELGAVSLQGTVSIFISGSNAPPRPACVSSSTLFMRDLGETLASSSIYQKNVLTPREFQLRLSLETSARPKSTARRLSLGGVEQGIAPAVLRPGGAQLICNASTAVRVHMAFPEAQQGNSSAPTSPSDVRNVNSIPPQGNVLAILAYDRDSYLGLTYQVVKYPTAGTLAFLTWDEEAVVATATAAAPPDVSTGGTPLPAAGTVLQKAIQDDREGLLTRPGLSSVSVAAGWPVVVYYLPDPLRRGEAMDSFQWVAVDEKGLQSDPATVVIQVSYLSPHHCCVATALKTSLENNA